MGVNKAALMQQETLAASLAQSTEHTQVKAPQCVLHHTSAQLSSHGTMCQCSSKLSARSFQLHQPLPLFSRHYVLMTPDLFIIIHYSTSTRSQGPASIHSNSMCGNQEDSSGKRAEAETAVPEGEIKNEAEANIWNREGCPGQLSLVQTEAEALVHLKKGGGSGWNTYLCSH